MWALLPGQGRGRTQTEWEIDAVVALYSGRQYMTLNNVLNIFIYIEPPMCMMLYIKWKNVSSFKGSQSKNDYKEKTIEGTKPIQTRFSAFGVVFQEKYTRTT